MPDAPGAHVTLIVPTFNRAHVVAHAIDSALAQTYEPLDIVVVDDGSTDDTAEVLRRYEGNARVRVVVRPANGGVLAAKNTGLSSLPEGCAYFGILDSDDVLTPEAVSDLVAGFATSDPPPSQVFGWCVDADTGEATGSMHHQAGTITYEDAICGRFTGEFWQLVRRDALGDLRFDERAGGNEAMVWWPLLKRAPAVLLDVVVRRYDRSGQDRVNRPAFTARGAERKMWGYHELLERTGADTRDACPQHYAFLCLEEAKWAALAGHWRACVRGLGRAWSAQRSWRVAKVGLLAVIPSPLLRRMYALLYRNAR